MFLLPHGGELHLPQTPLSSGLQLKFHEIRNGTGQFLPDVSRTNRSPSHALTVRRACIVLVVIYRFPLHSLHMDNILIVTFFFNMKSILIVTMSNLVDRKRISNTRTQNVAISLKP